MDAFEFPKSSEFDSSPSDGTNFSLSTAEDIAAQMLDPLPMLPLEQAALMLSQPQTILSTNMENTPQSWEQPQTPPVSGSKRKFSLSSADITDEEFAMRNELRLQNNRVSAKMSRERKKKFVSNLEMEVNRLRETCLHLEAMKRVLWKQNEELQVDLTHQNVAAHLRAVQLTDLYNLGGLRSMAGETRFAG